jgi:hypothetical protein
VAGSFDVRRNSVSAEVRTPGWITPPRKTPSLVMQSYVVAVPRSTTMQSLRYIRLAASVLMMRSAPTVIGSSTARVMPRGERASTTIAGLPVRRALASASAPVTEGTTEPMAAPVSCTWPSPRAAMRPCKRRCISSGVRAASVFTRQCATIASPSARPSVVSVLPTSATSSIRDASGVRRENQRAGAPRGESAGGFN